MAELYLSVVIPAFNEESRLRWALPQVVEQLEKSGRPFEIIVVNDGSRDGTANVVRQMESTYSMLRLIDLQPNRGKGGAVKAGMLAARGEYVLFTDADQSTPISELDKLLVKITAERYDMAIGSRATAGSQVEKSQVWYRKLAGKLFGLGTRTFAIRGIADTQCGFKCMTQAVAQRVFSQVTSQTAIFDIEMLIVATREGYRVAEVPVKWVHDPDTRIPYNLRRSIAIWLELFRINRAQRVVWPLQVKR